MKYHLLLTAAATGFALAVPAQAQDLSGFRIEARGAWEKAGVEASLSNPDDDESETGDEFLTASDDDSDISYGLELGYDVQVGRGFVLGAYAGADLSNSEVCGELLADDLACAGLDRTFTLGARAGVPLGERSLLYVKGGYSNGKFEGTYDADVTDNDDEEPGVIEEFSKTHGGYHLGGGVELGLTRSLYAKLEYVYTDYGSRTYRLASMDDEAPGAELSSDRHQVVAGIGLKF